jgi:hypothetical protein
MIERQPGFERSALVAQVLAWVMLGHPDSGRAVAARLRTWSPSLALFADQLHGVLVLVDPPPAADSAWSTARARLAPYAGSTRMPDLRRRAAWLLALLARRHGSPEQVAEYRRLLDDEPRPSLLARLVRADATAGAGRPEAALAASDTLTAVLAGDVPDPFFRASVHFLRASWYERLGEPGAARRELLWHENQDLDGHPVGDPQAADVDWALGVLARWRRAELAARVPGGGPEACRLYAEVVRLWTTGGAPPPARADSARERRTALGCEAAG